MRVSRRGRRGYKEEEGPRKGVGSERRGWGVLLVVGRRKKREKKPD